MGYKTFISNTTATLSMAAVVSLGYSTTEAVQVNSTYEPFYVVNNSFTGSTYNGISTAQENANVELQELDTVLEFANKLITNSKPLDADIAKLVDDNIMDLLA